MSPEHFANIAVHVGSGTIAMAIGLYMLARRKGTPAHRRWGRLFCYFTLLVCFSAAVGTVFFRFLPLFAVLNVLVLYQLVSGWRSAYTQGRGPAAIDAAWTVIAAVSSGVLVPILLAAPGGASMVVYASLGALAFILLYDALRWLFPRRWFHALWRYEHSYKLISSIFAMLSALVGNVVRVGQPWSQIAPSVAGTLVVAYFFYRLSRQDPVRHT
ncbi:hypothetical protein [Usitatibacter palustris]|uniref:DUF2306 domain-containing protein n=1 Tax=Usitatibacter palustris TaxID=2732487 RepID=A0A6M4H4S7_9PROT|nr:hypothetical protein [Usitatibacter palustris]QJR13524.1 hypothetical protein DSM104440_00308 [Usitatibacter palustris]